MNFIFTTFGRTSIKGHWFVTNDFVCSKLYYVFGGSAHYIYKGKKYFFKKGYMYLIPSTVYVEYFHDEAEDFDHLFFNFISSPPLMTNEILEFIPDEKMMKLIEFSSLSLKNERYKYKAGDIVLAEHIVNLMISLISEMIGKEIPRDKRIISAVEFIHNRYAENITIDRLAKDLYLETNYFIKLFKKSMGVSPYQYIKNYRLNIALNHIRNGMSIKDAGAAAGFETASAFSAAVKKSFGVSPKYFADNPSIYVSKS